MVTLICSSACLDTHKCKHFAETFILQQLWEENLGTQAGVHLTERVRLIWGPLNADVFTVEYLGTRMFFQSPFRNYGTILYFSLYIENHINGYVLH